MNRAMQKQPVITITTITTAVSAVFAALVAFGLPVSDAQQDSILGLIAALYPIITAAWTWHRVYAPSTVHDIVVDVSGDPNADIPNVAK